MQSALPQPHHAGGTGLNGKCWWVILLVQRLWSHQPSSKGGILLIKRIASLCLSEIPVAMGLLCFLQTINVPLAYSFSWNHGIMELLLIALMPFHNNLTFPWGR